MISVQPDCDCESKAAELTRARRVLPDQLVFEAPPVQSGIGQVPTFSLIKTNRATLHLSESGPRCVCPETQHKNALCSSWSQPIYPFKIDEFAKDVLFRASKRRGGSSRETLRFHFKRLKQLAGESAAVNHTEG